MQAINSILEAMGLRLPMWAGPVIALTLVVLFLPAILRNFKISRARKILQRSRVYQPQEKIAAGQQALEVVGDIPMGLVGVADEALRQGRPLLAHEAVRRLIATGKVRDHAKRLVRVLEEDGGPGSAEELVLIVERFVGEGMTKEAQRRLQQGLRRWPSDPGLVAWQRRLDDNESVVSEESLDD